MTERLEREKVSATTAVERISDFLKIGKIRMMPLSRLKFAIKKAYEIKKKLSPEHHRSGHSEK